MDWKFLGLKHPTTQQKTGTISTINTLTAVWIYHWVVFPDVLPFIFNLLTNKWRSMFDNRSVSFPDGLTKLPLEILVMIFDHILTEQTRLTYLTICTFRSLFRTNRIIRKHVLFFFNLSSTKAFVHQAFVDTKFWTSPLQDFNLSCVPVSWYDIDPPGEDRDLITQIIKADRPSSFNWLRQWILPGLGATGFNEHNWSFISLATHYKSIRMLDYFFKQDSASVLLLFQRANPGFDTYEPIANLARAGDVHFVAQVMNLLKPHTRAIKQVLEDREHIVFPSSIKYSFCKFITPQISEQFKELGVVIYDFTEFRRQGNPYHAAASNNAEFLNYLCENLDIPTTSRNRYGETPLQFAKRANNPETIRWFQSNQFIRMCRRIK